MVRGGKDWNSLQGISGERRKSNSSEALHVEQGCAMASGSGSGAVSVVFVSQ